MPNGFDDIVNKPLSEDPLTPVRPKGFEDVLPFTPYTPFEAQATSTSRAGFRGDSQYDAGLVYGMNQMRNRAFNQPWYDQLGNSATKVLPGIALGIIENAGYLGELFDNSHDYTNALTEFAKKHRQSLEENLPAYRENPDAVFDLSDPAWWFQHGEGLAESIGEFLITGAGVGSILGKTAKGLSSLIASRFVEAGLKGAAQLGTASFLAYTEGAMSGADVYQQVLRKTGDKEKAAAAAAHTVRLNTLINTGLNLTAIKPMFKTLDDLKATSKIGLNRLPGESLSAWETRIDNLVAQGYQPASLRKALLLEAGQESGEELVNLFAENEGLIKGGVKESSKVNLLSRFIESSFTKEGALSALLGAIGGLGQTAGMNLLPFRNYTDEEGNPTRVNNYNLEILQGNRAMQEQLALFKEDITTLRKGQKELDAAVKAGDTASIVKARNKLFNVALLKSIREGVGEEFAEDLQQIADTDNTTVGDDGMTEAMRKGYALDQKDNQYKETAQQRIQDIKRLSTEYQNLRKSFKNKFVADQVFRERLNVYEKENLVNDLRYADEQLTKELIPQSRKYKILVADSDALIGDAINLSANVSALKTILANTGKETNSRFVNNIKNVLTVEEKVLNDTLTPDIKEELDKHQGLIGQLLLSRVPLLAAAEELNLERADYDKLLQNKKETEKAIQSVIDEVIKQEEAAEREKAEQENEAKEEADKEAAQQQAAQEELEEELDETLDETEEEKVEKPKPEQEKKNKVVATRIGPFVFTKNPDGTVSVFDEEAGVSNGTFENMQAAKQAVGVETKKAPVTIPEPKPEPDTSFHGHTPAEEEAEIEQLNTELVFTSTNQATKLAYASREKGTDTGPINPRYLTIHSKNINIGTPVVIRVDTEHPFYKQGKTSPANAPMGVYTEKGELLGYVATLKGNNPELEDIRNFIHTNGEVKTTISDKGPGKLNWHSSNPKRKVSDALPTIKKLVIAKDGKLWSGPKKEYVPTTNLNQRGYKDSKNDGRVYAVVETPNGQEFAVILDTAPISTEIRDSVMTAFRLFMMGDQLDQYPDIVATVKEIFKLYDIDLRTPEGFGKYFKTFFYNYDLKDPKRIEENNKDQNDKRWVNWAGSSIRFMKSGGAVTTKGGELRPKEIGRDTKLDDPIATERLREGLLSELSTHLGDMYFNVSLESLQTNEEVKLPILMSNEEGITFKEYYQPSYEDHIKNITETRLVAEPIGDNEYTYFVNPETHFNTAFLGKPAEEQNGKPLAKPLEKSEESGTFKGEAAPSLTKSLPKNLFDKRAVDPSIIKQFKDYCSNV